MLNKAVHKVKQKFRMKSIASGTTDIMVVRWKNGEYKSTLFFMCFGGVKNNNQYSVNLVVNGIFIQTKQFAIDEHGYLDPPIPSQKVFEQMQLRPGRNQIQIFVCNTQNDLRSQVCQLFLYDEEDKLIVSDVDGTLTKSDMYGLACNIVGKNHLHNGYIDLISKAHQNGYKIIWLTMRSINLYMFSKKYIWMHTKIPGALFTMPEQLLSALKKQLTKQTIDAKVNLMRKIRQIFPENVNPFVGGLGNRQNDALAYTTMEIPTQKIFIVNKDSIVQRWGSNQMISYEHISTNIQQFFPKLKQIISNQNTNKSENVQRSQIILTKMQEQIFSKIKNNTIQISENIMEIQKYQGLQQYQEQQIYEQLKFQAQLNGN